MVPQQALSAPHIAESDALQRQIIDRARAEEPAVPVYRQFLSGGAEQYCLGPGRVWCLSGISLIATLGSLWARGQALHPASVVGAAVSTPLVCVLLGSLVARWAGRPSGALAGWLAMIAWVGLCSIIGPSVLVAGAAAIASILFYGLAELPHRRPVFSRSQAQVLFFVGAALSCALTGPACLAPIAVVCLGTILGNENSRAVGFFVSPGGLAILGGGVAIGCFGPMALSWPGTPWSQWMPISMLALGLAWTYGLVHTGHAANPLGRLLISWLLGPPLLAAVGAISVQLVVALTLPAWGAGAGMALIAARQRFRRRQRLR